MSVTSTPAKAFTDEMLAHNFRGIDAAFREVMGFMQATNGNVEHLLKKTSKSPSKVKPFFAGAAVGVLVYRAYKQNQSNVNAAIRDSGVGEKIGEAVGTVKNEVKDKL